MDDVGAILNAVGGKAKVTMWLASFVGLDGSFAMCDIANGDKLGRVPAKVTTPYRPEINEQVFVAAIDGKYFLLGPSVPKPAQGTVTAVQSNTATVSTDQGTVTASVGVGMTLSAGQVVKLFWSDGAHVLAALTAAPTPVVPPPPPDAGSSTHIDVFTAVDAGTYQNGRWWQDQPWASQSTIGAWFYGSKIRDTIQGGSVSRIQIYLPVVQRQFDPPNIGTHAYGGKVSNPSVQNAAAVGVGGTGWYDLPVSFGQYLVGNVGGIGLNHGGYNKFASLAADAQSGALRITSTY